MARIKRAVAAKKKRRTVMHRAKGYYGAASRTYKHAKEQVQHSLQYQYRDRRNKKREIRSLWITRINAAARLNDISYSQFMHGLKVAGIELDRKVLAQMAYEDIESFNELAAIAKKALEQISLMISRAASCSASCSDISNTISSSALCSQ